MFQKITEEGYDSPSTHITSSEYSDHKPFECCGVSVFVHHLLPASESSNVSRLSKLSTQNRTSTASPCCCRNVRVCGMSRKDTQDNDVTATILNVWRHIKNWTLSIDAYVLEEWNVYDIKYYWLATKTNSKRSNVQFCKQQICELASTGTSLHRLLVVFWNNVRQRWLYWEIVPSFRMYVQRCCRDESPGDSN